MRRVAQIPEICPCTQQTMLHWMSMQRNFPVCLTLSPIAVLALSLHGIRTCRPIPNSRSPIVRHYNKANYKAFTVNQEVIRAQASTAQLARALCSKLHVFACQSTGLPCRMHQKMNFNNLPSLAPHGSARHQAAVDAAAAAEALARSLSNSISTVRA